MLISDKYWEIKDAENKGRGLFAKKNILQGVLIGDYVGKVIRPEDAVVDEENFYLMYYHDRAVISPDLDKPGVHVLNNSCKPNCWFYIYEGHTLAFSMRKIKKGEELTIPYLLPPINKFCNPCPHVCKCGSRECTGTMHLSKDKYSAWRSLTEKQSMETKKERIKYGENLKILLSYPKIPISYINKVKEIL
jgi:SET domain-containing protein